MGCDGAYLQLRGLEGITGVYVGKLAPGRRQHPERHLYEKVIYILQGEGVAEIQQRDRVPHTISWRAGSLFSPPMNALHRLMNQGRDGVFLAVTTAPMALDHYHNEDFVFNSEFAFNDRYDGEAGYFEARTNVISPRTIASGFGRLTLFPMREAPIDAQEQKGAGSISPNSKLPIIS